MNTTDLRRAGADKEFLEWAKEWEWAGLSVEAMDALLTQEYRYAWREVLRKATGQTADFEKVKEVAQRVLGEMGIKELRWLFLRFGLDYNRNKLADLPEGMWVEFVERVEEVLTFGGSFAAPTGCPGCGYHHAVCACATKA